MNNSSVKYDCAIVGAGIAGLCLSIQLAKLGHKVVLFEKGSFPFHKVCGEYVSNESRSFFQELGLTLDKWDLPQINNIGISSAKGYMLNAPLLLGGFGISRFKLDAELAELARRSGVSLYENTRVTNVSEGQISTNKGNFNATIVAGAFGKSKPVFAGDSGSLKTNYIGVKYHVYSDLPSNRIELHNFKDGYCGISKVEAERYCLCYLSNSENLKKSNNSIKEMENKVLKQNPYLKKIFENSEFLFDHPVTISNIRFDARKTVDANMIFLGDAAGCISPLTGNGISMAAFSSKILASLLHKYFTGISSRLEIEMTYSKLWKKHFGSRINKGIRLQYLFGKNQLSHYVLRTLDPLGLLKSKIIESTHGAEF